MDLISIAVIKKDGDKYCIFSEKTSRRLGCYANKKKALERLRQIEHFKKSKGRLISEMPIGDDQDSGVLYEFGSGSLYCLVADSFLEVKKDSLELEDCTASAGVPAPYWSITNIYTSGPMVDGEPVGEWGHSHVVVVDENGDGFTTFDTSGPFRKDSVEYKNNGGEWAVLAHRHSVENWIVQVEEGHSHDIRGLSMLLDVGNQSDANSLEVYSVEDSDNDMVIFDNMVVVPSELSDRAQELIEELIESKKKKEKSKKLKRKIKTNKSMYS